MCIRYLIGCDNILAKIHTRNPSACDKVDGVIIMHIDDLRRFALLWLHKSEEVRADKDHYATNITGDIYNSVHFLFFQVSRITLFFLHCTCKCVTNGNEHF